MPSSSIPVILHKPRVFILTDITNEPDDAESFCRYLTYANQFQTEGVVAVTSVWLRDRVAPEKLHEIIGGYEKVVDNFNAHVNPSSPYPSADDIRKIIKSGPAVYGMAAVSDDIPLSSGAELLLSSLLSISENPLWVLAWGGVNVLASVLHRIRNRPDATTLRSKLRVYTISDQDDTGAWIRQQWPDIFYICSVHGWNQYSNAAWIGISGAVDSGGPDEEVVSKDWVTKNIQNGPLGSCYPTPAFIIEGDTPTFLYLMQNGLNFPEEPSWGSWGGRYLPVNVGPGGNSARGHFADCDDAVVGKNGETFRTNKATIWRWRTAFQNDFAARMQWTLASAFNHANHAPVVLINGTGGLSPIEIEVDAGSVVRLDARMTYDPDGDELAFKWWQYQEPSATQTYHGYEVSILGFALVDGTGGSVVDVSVPPPDKSCVVVRDQISLERGLTLHVILEVMDNGSPPLTSYRRVLLKPVNRQYKGPGVAKKLDDEVISSMIFP